MNFDAIVDAIDASHDGPYDRDQVIAAARALAAVVRYLNSATQHPSDDHPNTLSEVLGDVSAAVHGFDQLFRQLSNPLDDRDDDLSLTVSEDLAMAQGHSVQMADYLDHARKSITPTT